MLKKLGLALVLALSLTTGAFGFTYDWPDAYETTPADNEKLSLGAGRIRALKNAVRERLQEEHNFSAVDTGTDDGTHKEGSARLFIQSAAPATTPGGAPLVDGYLWLDSDDEKFYVYESSAWVELLDSDDEMTLSTAQTATGAKIFADALFKKLALNSTTVTAATYTTGVEYAFYLCDASSNAITLTLPAISGYTERLIAVKKIDSSTNTVTIDGNGAETIDNASTNVLSAENDAIVLLASSEWNILAELDNSGADDEYSYFAALGHHFAGDGSDGDGVFSGTGAINDQYDSDADDGILEAEFDDLTFSGTTTVESSVKVAIIGVKGTLTLTGTFSASGRGGAGGAGAFAADGDPGTFGGQGLALADQGSNLAANPTDTGCANMAGGGGAGGGGGLYAGGDGGAAGAKGGAGVVALGGGSASAVSAWKRLFYLNRMPKDIHKLAVLGYGAGGGGGAGGAGAATGGAGAGVLYIEANAIVWDGGALTAAGANGGNGTVDGGGGGGGGGGLIVYMYRTASGSASTSVTAGSGGTGAGGDGNGGAGAAGKVYALDING